MEQVWAMTASDIIAALNEIDSRDALLTFLLPLRVPHKASDEDRARLTAALTKAAARCWKGRASG
jgi:hypothetical protein